MDKLKDKRELLVNEFQELQTRYNNLAGNLKQFETRMIEIQGAVKTIDEMMNAEISDTPKVQKHNHSQSAEKEEK